MEVRRLFHEEALFDETCFGESLRYKMPKIYGETSLFLKQQIN